MRQPLCLEISLNGTEVMDVYRIAGDHEAAVKDPKLLGGPSWTQTGQVEKVAERAERTLRDEMA